MRRAAARRKAASLPAGARDVTDKFKDLLPELATRVGEARAAASAAAPQSGAPHVTSKPKASPVPNPSLSMPAGSGLGVPYKTLLSPLEVMKGAVNSTYLGNLSEEDLKDTVTRTVQITRAQDVMIGHIIQDDNFGYEGAKAQYIRHMIEMGLTYYLEKGLLPEERVGYFGDMLRAARMLREDAAREKTRENMAEDIKTHDRALDVARGTGDWALVAQRLRRYMDALESCEAESQRRILRGVFAESASTRTAVHSFNRWLESPNRPPKEGIEGWEDWWPEIATQWETWYNEYGGV